MNIAAELETLSGFLEGIEDAAGTLARADMLTTAQATEAFRDFAASLHSTREFVAVLKILTEQPE